MAKVQTAEATATTLYIFPLFCVGERILIKAGCAIRGLFSDDAISIGGLNIVERTLIGPCIATALKHVRWR